MAAGVTTVRRIRRARRDLRSPVDKRRRLRRLEGTHTKAPKAAHIIFFLLSLRCIRSICNPATNSGFFGRIADPEVGCVGVPSPRRRIVQARAFP